MKGYVLLKSFLSAFQMNKSLPCVFSDPAIVAKFVSTLVDKSNGLHNNIQLDKSSMIPPNPAQLLLAASLSQHVLREASDCFIQVGFSVY
jgi:hypothetical protein